MKISQNVVTKKIFVIPNEILLQTSDLKKDNQNDVTKNVIFEIILGTSDLKKNELIVDRSK